MGHSRSSNSVHPSHEVLLILYVIHYVGISYDFNIASFAFQIAIFHAGRDTDEAIREKQFWQLFTPGFVNSICDSLGWDFI